MVKKKNSTLRIYNGFGITPVTNCKAAGHDFFVPKFNGIEKKDIVFEGFEKSYKRTAEEMDNLINRLVFYVTAEYGEEFANNNELNLLLLYLSLDSTALRLIENEDDRISAFVDDYLVFDDAKVPGLNLQTLDHVFINSGIKVALDPDTAGVFKNKSGKGIKGFDIRACLIDEDYSGYVHLNLAYTKYNECDGIFYCGDKITQMVIIPIIHHDTIEEVSTEEYEKLMSGTQRGSNAFGSSDVKH